MAKEPTQDNPNRALRSRKAASAGKPPGAKRRKTPSSRASKEGERYRDILESIEEAYYEVDLRGNLTFFNSVAVKRLGYANEEMMGMSFRQFTDQENARKLFEAYHEVFITGSTIKGLEWEFVNKLGEHIPVESSVALVKDMSGSPIGFRGVVRDITARRQVQEQLRRSEEQYRAIFENTGSASILFGEDTVIQLVNSNFARLSGFSKQEIEGKMSWTRFIHRDDLDRLKKYHVMRRENPGSAPHSYEFKAVTRTGEPMDIFMNIALIPGTSVSIASMVDITERKRMERALQQSEAKYRFLTEHMNDVIWTTDLDLNLTYFSPSVERMVGYTQEERMRQKIEETMTPESLAKGLAILARELEREGQPGVDPARTVTFEGEYFHKNGSMVWVENKASAIRNEQGTMVGIYGVSRDITERKRSEEALRKSEERYRTIFEHTATANIIASRDTTILLANSNFAHITGYSREEMEGRMSWTGFVHPEDLETMNRYRKMRGERPGSAPWSYEIRMVHRTGEIRNLLLSSAVLPGTHDTIASMIDITEWKRSEKARTESEERFGELAELLPETVYEADKNGIFTFVNKTGFEKFGYTQEDFAKGRSVFDMIVPEDHARMLATYQRLVRGERVGLGEYTARRKDGSTFPALVYATAIFREGRPVGHRGFVIDTTEKKALEDQILRAQKMESIGTLAGGIAHDFNNLLMGILGNISLILLHVDQSSPVYDRLKSMEDYVQRGSDLTKQLLGFARGGKYEVKPTDIGEFVTQSSELFGRTKREIRIHRNFPEDLWTVEVDRGQLEQVLINLFVNAWQAMPGGGDLYLSAQNVELDEVSVSPYGIAPGRFVRVTVTDTGIGMDEATRARIFEPFFTTKERGRGTGLGLASAYGIIKNHGGFILVESVKGIGSSFIIHLPASDREVERVQQPEDELMKGQGTILLIDDEEMILEVGARMLENLGYRVIPAAGGRKGLQAFEQERETIDLVVLDMIMPGFGGNETFDALKRIRPDVKVLLSSGYSLDGQAKAIMEKGCRGFIQKPFTMADLSRKIRGILDER